MTLESSFYMRAWDPDNSRFCFWFSTDPLADPIATEPAAILAHLTNKAIVHAWNNPQFVRSLYVAAIESGIDTAAIAASVEVGVSISASESGADSAAIQFVKPNTLLLLHGDLVTTSTNIVDEAGKTITANGGAQIAADSGAFGGCSINFPGSGSYLSLGNLADFDVATGTPFTFDTILQSSSTGDYRGIISRSGGYGGWNGTNGYFYLLLTQPNGKLLFQYCTGGTSFGQLAGATNVCNNTRNHLEINYDGSILRMFVNGALEASATPSFVKPSAVAYTWINGAIVGGNTVTAPDAYFITGKLEEIRWSNIARHTSNFTAPTAPFTID